MDTIVPVALATATKFCQAMQARGVGNDQMLQALQDAITLNQVAALMNPVTVDLDLSGEFDHRAMDKLVKYLFGDFISFQHVTRRSREAEPHKYVWLNGGTPEGLAHTDVLKQLLDGLSELHIAVVVLRSGLLDGREVPVREVVERLGLSSGKQAGHLRTQANAHIKARQRELFPFGRWVLKGSDDVDAVRQQVTLESPIEELHLPLRATSALERNGIHTVGQLIACTRGDLIDVRNLGRIHIDEIERVLSVCGLELRQGN